VSASSLYRRAMHRHYIYMTHTHTHTHTRHSRVALFMEAEIASATTSVPGGSLSLHYSRVVQWWTRFIKTSIRIQKPSENCIQRGAHEHSCYILRLGRQQNALRLSSMCRHLCFPMIPCRTRAVTISCRTRNYFADSLFSDWEGRRSKLLHVPRNWEDSLERPKK
jgi:hypothetical protein